MNYRDRLTRIIITLIDVVFGLAVLGLFIRFLLRLFGANPAAEFTQFIYNSTAPLLDPFEGIFRSYVINPGNVIELSTLVAIVVYLIIAYLLVELVEYISYNARSTYRRPATAT